MVLELCTWTVVLLLASVLCTYVVVWGPDADDVGVAAVHSDVVRCRTTAAGVKLVTEDTTITATAIVGRKYMVMVDSVCESHNNVRSMAHSMHLIETRTQPLSCGNRFTPDVSECSRDPRPKRSLGFQPPSLCCTNKMSDV
jgi:hypothetical protein